MLSPSSALPFEADKKPFVLDIETQYLANEVVGGWDAIDKFRVSVAVSWDPDHEFRVWTESLALELIEEAMKYSPIITFNGEGFDFKVLQGYGNVKELYHNSLDLLSVLKAKLRHRVRLDSVATATLNENKTADGLQAVEWWRSGDEELRQKVISYCTEDVRITRDIYFYAKKNGFVVIEDLNGNRKKVEIKV